MARRPDQIDLRCKGQGVFSPLSDMASTPGGQSLGQRSLGVESSTSGYSVNSASKLLKGGSERDVIIDEQLCQLPIQTEDRQCGIGRFRPKCIQWCASIKLFVFFMCLLITMSGTLSTGYLNSVITTIEKRFEIGSSISGLIAASYEFGSLVAVIFISYFGGRRHIPRWIGKGVILMGFGALLFALPHIIAKKYTVHQGIISNLTDENICKIVGSKRSDENCIDKNAGNLVYVLILITAQILIGTGGTPIFTLGTTYIDNHVPKDKAPAYLAFTYATGALGPVVGYALGALLLQFYVDVFSYKVDLSPAHPRWIGAWWGGFIICGLVLFAIAVPFLMFPQVLVDEKRKVLESKAREDLLTPTTTEGQTRMEDYGKDAKDIPRSVLSLLKNKIYLVTSFGICCEISIVSGFVVFLPKYMETQFERRSLKHHFSQLHREFKNLCGIAIPGAVFGVLMGGFLLKRFQMGPKGAIQLTILLDALALIGCGFFFFLGCDNRKIAGATFPYFNSSGYNLVEDYEFEANLTSTCNMYCDCSNNDLEPICGINGLTYFSPCHAGCTQFNTNEVAPDEKIMNFTGCSCILGDHLASEVIMSPMATSGPCKSTCKNLLPFLILLVFMTFCVAGTQMPILMVTLRSVREVERCFALGMQFVILRLFAYIPAPMVFGHIIDTACLLWRQKCGGNGSCLLYNIEMFRHRYVGTSAVLKMLGGTLFGIVWILIRRKNREEEDKHNKGLSVGEMMNSVVSINKLDLTSKPSTTCKEGNPDQASDESDQEDVYFRPPGNTDLEPDGFTFGGKQEDLEGTDGHSQVRTRESKL